MNSWGWHTQDYLKTRFPAFLDSSESIRSLKDLTLTIYATELGYYFPWITVSKEMKTGLENSWDPWKLKSSREDYPGPFSPSRNPLGFWTEEP